MVMKAGMFFKFDDWKNKLSKAQKSKLLDFKEAAKAAKGGKNNFSSSYNVNNLECNPTILPDSSSNVTLPSSNPGANVRQVLSNSTSRDPDTIVPQQVTFAGRAYSLNVCKCIYNINKYETTSHGALLDGGANGGMSGSDVRVLSSTQASADATGIGILSTKSNILVSMLMIHPKALRAIFIRNGIPY
jgi:hypothetical protein